MTLARTHLLALVLLLLAAVALVTLAHSLGGPVLLPPGPGEVVERQERAVFLPVDPSTLLLVSYVVALVTGAGFLAAYLKYVRKGKRGFLLVELVPLVVIVLLLLAMALLIDPAVEDLMEEEEGEEEGTVPGTDPGVPTEGGEALLEPVRRLVGLPPQLLLALMALGVLVGVYLLVLWARHRSRAVPEEEIWEAVEEEVRREAAQAVGRSIYGLELGEDVRSVVLRCYRDMVELFRSRGLRQTRYLTAREVEALARENLGLTGESAVALRRLFEEARYSVHELPRDRREGALQALRGVQRELGA